LRVLYFLIEIDALLFPFRVKALQRVPAIRVLIQINVQPPIERNVPGHNERLFRGDERWETLE
jgi:hypothetical protein